MKTPLVIGIGELLWDVLPSGKQLGGAPFNFVYHAQKLGATCIGISAVGKDELGAEIIKTLSGKGLSTQYIQQNEYPTSTVDVKLDEKGIPNYVIHENVAWDYIQYTKEIGELVANADIVCFGSLTQRNSVSQLSVKSILNMCKPACMKVFDVNLRQSYYSKKVIEESLGICTVLKLNEDELPVLCKLLRIEGSNEIEKLKAIMNCYQIDTVAYTLGVNGSYIIASEATSFMETPKVEVRDTIGAGDALTAAMVIEIAKKQSLKDIHKKAIEISATVCTKNGAMPAY